MIKMGELLDVINIKYLKGYLDPKWSHCIDYIYITYRFDEELIMTLFKVCYEHEHFWINIPYVLKVAHEWYSAGVKTVEDYEEYTKNNIKSKELEFTGEELKLIYHAMYEIKEAETLHYIEADELELNTSIRKKIEDFSFLNR